MPDDRPIDPREHRALAGASRVRVLEYLRARGAAVPATEVARHVGLHANTVRLHLDHLTDVGLAARAAEPRTGPGRPRLLYSAVPPPSPAVAEDGYASLAGVLAGQLEATGRSDERAADAGRAWGRALTPPLRDPVAVPAATERLVRLMDGLGFAPVAAADGDAIDLHRCPFRQVAEQHPGVVCGVHLGLMQGVLEDLGAPLRVSRLEPFVAPGLCRAHLVPGRRAEGDPVATHPSIPRE